MFPVAIDHSHQVPCCFIGETTTFLWINSTIYLPSSSSSGKKLRHSQLSNLLPFVNFKWKQKKDIFDWMKSSAQHEICVLIGCCFCAIALENSRCLQTKVWLTYNEFRWTIVAWHFKLRDNNNKEQFGLTHRAASSHLQRSFIQITNPVN